MYQLLVSSKVWKRRANSWMSGWICRCVLRVPGLQITRGPTKPELRSLSWKHGLYFLLALYSTLTKAEEGPSKPCPQWSSKSQFCSQIRCLWVPESWLSSTYKPAPLQGPKALLELQAGQKRQFGSLPPPGCGRRLHEDGRSMAWMPCS